MLARALVIAVSAIGALAADAVFNPPKTELFLSIAYQVGIPVNTTTPSGVVGTVPVRGGDIKGSLFNGYIVPNLTSSVEKYQPVVNNVVTTVSLPTHSSGRLEVIVADLSSKSYDGRFVFENSAGDRIFAEILGSTAYGKDLHGFGYAKLETTAPCLQWINTAMFIAEWQGVFYRGSGTTVEIFHVNTGGRVDGQPIDAIPPSADI
ncbi:uncharacterized protein TRUGW13939_10674 [Talaromyces rugulosus]|uniref:Uncharacterized protein n=1 Tax=Talaromyces rugulosus TaxID=121627 RepID=A0A7H8RG03_TALRU|nr:uncharacterized protein TRUGW13939_10674 [Talaromyces rugulosus]QKX63503.1 hypothetical protein TRUGW13939_10674 [Talaromyces rugulosus]